MEAEIQTIKEQFSIHAENAYRKFNLSDWLAVHEVTAKSIEHTLNNARYLNQVISTGRMTCQHQPDQSPATAWNLVAGAFGAKFSAVASSIEIAQSNIEIDFQANEHQSELPFTLDRRPSLGPLVSLQFRGTSADLICLAHEFAHAIQIQLTTHRFINPVLRELAAFIGELALSDHLVNTKSHVSKAIDAVWQLENRTYLGTDVDNLKRNLSNDDAPYDYRWNYPVARILAQRLYECLTVDQLWQVFLGNVPLDECIGMADFSLADKPEKDYIPESPDTGLEHPALSAYRCLGMMSLLDLNSSLVWAEDSIEKYYADHLQHMQNETVFVVLNDQKEPIAYATWNVSKDNGIMLTRQSAPFGNHIELQKTLRKMFPENTIVRSHHDRSARKEQVAW